MSHHEKYQYSICFRVEICLCRGSASQLRLLYLTHSHTRRRKNKTQKTKLYLIIFHFRNLIPSSSPYFIIPARGSTLFFLLIVSMQKRQHRSLPCCYLPFFFGHPLNLPFFSTQKASAFLRLPKRTPETTATSKSLNKKRGKRKRRRGYFLVAAGPLPPPPSPRPFKYSIRWSNRSFADYRMCNYGSSFIEEDRRCQEFFFIPIFL